MAETGQSRPLSLPEGPNAGPSPAIAIDGDEIGRVPVATRLPAGLTEDELFQGYSRPRSGWIDAAAQSPHPVEVVALGAVLACTIAALLGVWPWGGAL
jgi:hypothetical protein